MLIDFDNVIFMTYRHAYNLLIYVCTYIVCVSVSLCLSVHLIASTCNWPFKYWHNKCVTKWNMLTTLRKKSLVWWSTKLHWLPANSQWPTIAVHDGQQQQQKLKMHQHAKTRKSNNLFNIASSQRAAHLFSCFLFLWAYLACRVATTFTR